jgi:hypothetical protein
LKTDDKDPRVIADIIRLGRALSVIVPEGDTAYLRRLNNARERHIREQTALLNQLQQLVFLIFPEFMSVFKDMKGKTARGILRNYTTPKELELSTWINSAMRCGNRAWAGSGERMRSISSA